MPMKNSTWVILGLVGVGAYLLLRKTATGTLGKSGTVKEPDLFSLRNCMFSGKDSQGSGYLYKMRDGSFRCMSIAAAKVSAIRKCMWHNGAPWGNYDYLKPAVYLDTNTGLWTKQPVPGQKQRAWQLTERGRKNCEDGNGEIIPGVTIIDGMATVNYCSCKKHVNQSVMRFPGKEPYYPKLTTYPMPSNSDGIA